MNATYMVRDEFVRAQAACLRLINGEKSLTKGVWYPNNYCDTLASHPQEKDGKRIKWLKDGNFCQKGYVPNSFEPQKQCVFTFVVKVGVAASTALDQLQQGLLLLECGTALQLSVWIALKNTIGPVLFDMYHSQPQNRSCPLYLQHGAYILGDIFQHVMIRGEEDLQPGDLCYFKNIRKYRKKHPYGLAEGYNSVYIAANKYMAFGLPVEGATSEEIERLLFEEYSKDPLNPYTYMTAAKAREYPNPEMQPALTWEQFQKEPSEDKNGIRGRLVLKVLRPSIDVLDRLKRESLSLTVPAPN